MIMSNGFLSQDEINALLNGEGGASDSPKPADNANGLSHDEEDLLGEIGNISMGSASTALYQIINQNVNITTPVISMATLAEIKQGFDAPTVVIDVKYISGIVGRNILIIKIQDAAVIANLMMGGDGKVSDSVELSEIEISAVQEAMNQMIGSAATSMAQMLGREVNISTPTSKIWKNNDDKLTEDIPEDEMLVKVSFNMTIGDLVDSKIMQVLPLPTAKKIVSIMMGTENKEVDEAQAPSTPTVEAQAPAQPAAPPEQPKVDVTKQSQPMQQAPSQPAAPPPVQQPMPQPKPVEVHSASFAPLDQSASASAPKNIDLILGVPLDISVVLGRSRMNIKDILALGTGSLIELDKLAEEPVEILVNGKQIAYGEVVVVDENFSVRITSIVSNADRIKSLK